MRKGGGLADITGDDLARRIERLRHAVPEGPPGAALICTCENCIEAAALRRLESRAAGPWGSGDVGAHCGAAFAFDETGRSFGGTDRAEDHWAEMACLLPALMGALAESVRDGTGAERRHARTYWFVEADYWMERRLVRTGLRARLSEAAQAELTPLLMAICDLALERGSARLVDAMNYLGALTHGFAPWLGRVQARPARALRFWARLGAAGGPRVDGTVMPANLWEVLPLDEAAARVLIDRLGDARTERMITTAFFLARSPRAQRRASTLDEWRASTLAYSRSDAAWRKVRYRLY